MINIDTTDFTRLAIKLLLIDSIIISFIVTQKMMGWNFFPQYIDGFVWAIAISLQVFTLSIYLIAILKEIDGINRKLDK